MSRTELCYDLGGELADGVSPRREHGRDLPPAPKTWGLCFGWW